MYNNARTLYIKSAPIRVVWRGWESTTTALQKEGWQLAAEQDIASNSMRIIIKHQEDKIYGVSDNVHMDYFADRYDTHKILFFHIKRMACQLHIQMMERTFNFKPIDAEPQFTNIPTARTIEDFAFFAPALVRTNEIIVPSDTVDTLMQRILEMQDPMVKKYYKEEALRNKDAAPAQKFVAQIISFDGMRKTG